MSQSEHNSE